MLDRIARASVLQLSHAASPNLQNLHWGRCDGFRPAAFEAVCGHALKSILFGLRRPQELNDIAAIKRGGARLEGYLLRFDLVELRASLADNFTTLPLRPMYTGNPRRTCSSIAFATATLKAISARFSSGNREMSLPVFIVCCRNVSKGRHKLLYLLYGLPPGFPTRRQLMKKTRHAPVAVRIGMDIAEQPVSEYGADGRFGFLFEQVEQLRHGVAHTFPSRRHITRGAQVNRVIPVSREGAGRQQARGDAGLEHLAVPVLVSHAHQCSGVFARDDFSKRDFHLGGKRPGAPADAA